MITLASPDNGSSATEDDSPCVGHHDPEHHPTGTPVWCLVHTERIRADLTRLLDLAALVARRRDGRMDTPRVEVGRMSRSDVPASPSPGFDTLDAVERWARDLANALARQLGRERDDVHDLDGLGRPLRDLAGDVAYLMHHLRPLLVGPLAIDAGEGIQSVARTLERLAGQERVRRHLSDPCPVCDRLALVHEDALDVVECMRCHHRTHAADYLDARSA